ncbi:nodulation-signaling pathway 1 protein-like [Durio zibethinus]|uniref:Nodulation-signaling pathway 1 protein-like n=1 Tax=Durio zibethinus TaxID=66656 RepID=A0A6P5WES9_DURZI|nr:nodulation-signaling pathway 1 protein-like [Durio zibethinus]
MTFEEAEPNPTPAHILDWPEYSVSFLTSFVDNPYNTGDVNSYQWWDQNQDIGQDLINISDTATSINSPTIAIAAAAAANTNNNGLIQSNSTIPNPPLPSNLSKRRKPSDDLVPRISQNHQHEESEQ